MSGAEWLKLLTKDEFDPRQRERQSVGAGGREGLFRYIGGDHLPGGPLRRDRQCDGTGSGSEVDDLCGSLRSQCNGPLHEEFSLRSRDQDGRIYRKPYGPKVAVADDVGDWLTCSSTFIAAAPHG